MEISKVHTAKKMGDFRKREDHEKYKINFEFLENISPETKKDRIGKNRIEKGNKHIKNSHEILIFSPS